MSGFLGTLACTVGLHSWTDWVYVQNGACTQTRKCGRCEKQATRVQHVWKAPFYKTTKDCLQVHICQRCNQEENVGVVHQWNDWSYTHRDKCDQIRICSRCNTKDHRVVHTWKDKLEYETDHKCNVSRKCQRCGAKKDHDIAHDMNDWVLVSRYQQVRKCKHCNAEQQAVFISCQSCNGSGQKRNVCPTCKGTGTVHIVGWRKNSYTSLGWDSTSSSYPCACRGQGYTSTCDTCNGQGGQWSIKPIAIA